MKDKPNNLHVVLIAMPNFHEDKLNNLQAEKSRDNPSFPDLDKRDLYTCIVSQLSRNKYCLNQFTSNSLAPVYDDLP